MVNINCSLNCIYQIDGKCTLKAITSKQKYECDFDNNCIYFTHTNENTGITKD